MTVVFREDLQEFAVPTIGHIRGIFANPFFDTREAWECWALTEHPLVLALCVGTSQEEHPEVGPGRWYAGFVDLVTGDIVAYTEDAPAIARSIRYALAEAAEALASEDESGYDASYHMTKSHQAVRRAAHLLVSEAGVGADAATIQRMAGLDPFEGDIWAEGPVHTTIIAELKVRLAQLIKEAQ